MRTRLWTKLSGWPPTYSDPFKTVLTQSTTDWTNTVDPELISAGFSIPVPFSGNPDSNNNLLEVTWSQTLTTTDPIQILGKTGFSYLDGAGGGLFGGITATGSVTVTLTLGVDVNPTSQQLNFFVAPGNNVVQATLDGFNSNQRVERQYQHWRPRECQRDRNR